MRMSQRIRMRECAAARFRLDFWRVDALAARVSSPPPFRLFGTAHLVVIALTVLLPVFFWATARGEGRKKYRLAIRWGLSALLLASWIGAEVVRAQMGQLTAVDALPMQLCDWALFAVVAALITCRRGAYEVSYFWGLAGTLQAVITPDLNVGFPHLVFFQYVVGHVGIVVAALFLVVGLRIAPRRRSVPRVLAITLAYSAVVGAVDALTGANYMFLRTPPAEWTLLRVLGPWPWYIASAVGVAAVLVTLLDAPFWPGRRRAALATPPPDRAVVHRLPPSH
jgi:hypothetical integral membrane protein (TIGR02206 family)